MKTKLFLSIPLALSASLLAAQTTNTAPAKDTASSWSVETSLSTLGLGLGVASNIKTVPGLSAALTGHYLQYKGDYDSGSTKVAADLNLSRIMAQGRYQIASSGAYVTGGLSFAAKPSIFTGVGTPAAGTATTATVTLSAAGSAIDGNATISWNGSSYTIPQITENVTYNGTTFTPAQINQQLTNNPTISTTSATIRVKYQQVSPYLGLGWTTNPTAAGWGFRTELGAILMGKPKIEVTVDGNAPDAAKAAFTQSIDKDIAKARDAASKFKAYPVIGFTVLYRF